MDSHGNSRSGQQQKRILIIDDEKDTTISLGTVLEEYGSKTDSYTDTVLALKNFKSGQYDLVILDIKMPVFNGFLLYQKIKKTNLLGKGRVIVVSVRSENNIILNGCSIMTIICLPSLPFCICLYFSFFRNLGLTYCFGSAPYQFEHPSTTNSANP